MRVGLATAALLVAAPAAAQSLSPSEKAMVRSVDAGFETFVALLRKLVDQNSGTLNLDGVTKVGAMMRAELEALGFTVTWKPMAEVGRAGHLIAVHRGAPGRKRILLIGHLDTVFEANSPFQRFVRKGNLAEGPGVGDDKGGMVVIIAALQAMKAAGTLKNANIEVHLTGDEEDAGSPASIARADLIAAGKRADVALDFEGLVQQDGRDMGSIARRSVTDWRITANGTTGHSSLIFTQQYGDGAINELARILAAFRKELPEPNLTFNPGVIAGGARGAIDDSGEAQAAGKTNIIAETATAIGDFRTLSEEQTRRVRAKMEAIVAAHAPGTDAKISFGEGYPAMAPTEGNKALLARLNAVNRDLGLAEMAPLDPLKRGAGDISFVAATVDSLAGLGTYSTGDHAPGETVDLDSIRRQAKRAAILISRMCAEREGRR
ncbi:M20/M25/M40 family metallo-hydrolase [Sphingomonas psychrotolerans]|uniref:M20/M25/M40 family metallo-hydrolase n=1 Tax=Sphingomonas psychrotolerans TaxID=1327635 RepID=A0ABU3MZ62_9SPHN|nr:M20/M25/M40 family metallo-hydrolase [Sphingomonas psychrotolerans]MDT8757311.1 M20/M25/M40 family metallo-hydrolase [Sphingomonas psychrotolerans]